ncbi:MAG: 1-deoxy-D-xylulose-5-phosphate reductoisomerase [Eubacterium sp.]|nr:1-deoxy-D-xylulose-5-phosphate reductoisomerase [Eubacterium sp.]
MKTVTILGSTGSIGTQALDVIDRNPDRFRVGALVCGHNIEKLRGQIRKYRPALAVCAEAEDAAALAKEFPDVELAYGPEGAVLAAESESDLTLSAITGIAGLAPTYHAIRTGHDIALANKETLVTGGRIIMGAAAEEGVAMLPVDSEHSAIFQCLEGNRDKEVRRILLTASGGPFRGYSREQLAEVTVQQALAHPNWSMGKKVTIDSASMMNKGLEMIEARWLFDVDIDRITVLVHPQSIVHSAVEFMDTSVLAQMGVPDMRIPISVALGYPDRLEFPADTALDFFGKASNLTFEKPDEDAFRCLALARDAIRTGGSSPVVMNAANEVLVQAFLDGKIGFLDIPRYIEEALCEDTFRGEPDLSEILAIDRETRKKVESKIAC